MEINGITVEPDLRYSEMDLNPGILKALDQKGFTLATPIQAGAIPCFKDWKDVIAKAPTGSGKTFAFGIPMVEHVDPENDQIQALVLAPTRELAIQIERQAKELFLLRKTLEEMELRIETQKQTLNARDESIKKLLEMLQSKGLSAKATEEDHERTRRLAEAEMHVHHLESLLEQKEKENALLREVSGRFLSRYDTLSFFPD